MMANRAEGVALSPASSPYPFQPCSAFYFCSQLELAYLRGDYYGYGLYHLTTMTLSPEIRASVLGNDWASPVIDLAVNPAVSPLAVPARVVHVQLLFGLPRTTSCATHPARITNMNARQRIMPATYWIFWSISALPRPQLVWLVFAPFPDTHVFLAGGV